MGMKMMHADDRPTQRCALAAWYREALAELKGSGQSVAEYAEKTGVTAATLYQWLFRSPKLSLAEGMNSLRQLFRSPLSPCLHRPPSLRQDPRAARQPAAVLSTGEDLGRCGLGLQADRKEVPERASCAIRAALLYCRGKPDGRRAILDSHPATLAGFAMITKTRGRRPRNAQDAEDVS